MVTNVRVVVNLGWLAESTSRCLTLSLDMVPTVSVIHVHVRKYK